EYIEGVVRRVDRKLIARAGFTTILDCANGATSVTSPYILEKLGCRVITLNASPQGTFPGHDSEPKPENLTQLINAVKDFGADFGVAHDGDGDRTIFIDENGYYVHGDRTLALVAREIVENKNGGIVVTGVSSSQVLEDVVKEAGGEVIYTRVGSPVVARKMMDVGAVFGGEENGGLIFPEHQYCRDGAMAMAKVIEIMAKYDEKLSSLISKLPRYWQKKISVPCPDGLKLPLMENLKKKLEGVGERMITIDGVKIFFKNGWVLIRPSGTESIVRIYAESKSEDRVNRIVDDYKKVVEEEISLLRG
ncbi:MAG: phosphoglucosamine mutase, partial [Thermoplasmata archaeon]